MTIDDLPLDWQSSGIVHEFFGLGRPTGPSTLFVPEIIGFKGDKLVYGSPSSTEETAPPSDLLVRFLSLRDAPESAIVDFARSYGVLALCEHGTPFAHCGNQQIYKKGGCRRGDWKPRLYFESIRDWRKLSRAFNATLNIFSRVRQGWAGLEEDWKTIDLPGRTVPPVIYLARPTESTESPDDNTVSALYRMRVMLAPQPSPKPNQRDRAADFDGRMLCQYWLNPMIRMGRLFPRLSWHGERINFELSAAGLLPSDAYNLFGSLILQLTLAVAGAQGFAVCGDCGKSFMPKKLPNPRRRRFCPDCGIKAARKFASRDYRRRQAGKEKPTAKRRRRT